MPAWKGTTAREGSNETPLLSLPLQAQWHRDSSESCQSSKRITLVFTEDQDMHLHVCRAQTGQ